MKIFIIIGKFNYVENKTLSAFLETKYVIYTYTYKHKDLLYVS